MSKGMTPSGGPRPKAGLAATKPARRATGEVMRLAAPNLDDLVRYRNPETGQTWCGFGRPPNWIRGEDRDKYRVR